MSQYLWQRHFRWINIDIKVVYLAFFGMFMLLQISVSKILTHRHLCYFKATKILQKWLQTWFILLHLVLVWNVHVKSIWTHSGGDVPRRLRPWSMAGGPMQELPIPKSRVLSRVQPSYTIVSRGYKVKNDFNGSFIDPFIYHLFCST